MRGQRTSISKQKIDVVLVAVRYEPASGELQLAQGFARRGPVWGDLELFDRARLIQRLQGGARIATGRPAGLAGDFELLGNVRVVPASGEGQARLAANGVDGDRDDLSLPLF